MKSNRPKKSAATTRTASPKPSAAGHSLSEVAPTSFSPHCSGPWYLHAAAILVLLLINLLLYWRATGVGFLSVDDPDYVLNNPYIDNFHAANLLAILTRPYSANYAPANLLSYSLDVALAGNRSAYAFHLSNVLWHGWVVCMVYLLAFLIAGRKKMNVVGNVTVAAAAAALFMLHPAHVEVVAWISSRKDLVATGFAVLSMSCFLLRRRASKHPAIWYIASLLSFLIASAAKQSVLLLPAVMLVWDVLVDKRRNWMTILDKVPFALVAAFFGWMTWRAQPGTGQSVVPFVLASTQFANLWLLGGFGQYVLYRAAPDPAAWGFAARLSIEAAAVVVWTLPWLFLRIRQPVRATLCYWVLIQMIPPMLLNFIVPITDRYLFLPSVGVCILLADVAATLVERSRKTGLLCGGLLAAVACVWCIKTSNYLAEWRDPRSVWYGAHFKTDSAQVAQFLGQLYQDDGERIDDFAKSRSTLDATNELKLAAAILGNPAQTDQLRAEWSGASSTRTNSIAYRDRLWQLAWEQYEAAVAHRGRLSAPNLFMCRGRLLVRQQQFQRAIPEFQNALALAENSHYERMRSEGVVNALYAIGVAYWGMGQYREAEQWLLRAQAVQLESGRIWIGTLDSEVQRIKTLAAGQR